MYLLLCVLTLGLLPVGWGQMWEWGPDLEGPWCAKRARGEQCCDDRDDYCSVPILGTECYCDVFCNTTAYDCCPDYWEHCHGIRRVVTTPFPLVYTTPRVPVTANNCYKNGVLFRPGDKTSDNCNDCMCEVFPGTPRRFDWRCTRHVCLIRSSLVDAVNDGRTGWRASNYSSLWGLTLKDGVKYRLGTFPLENDVVRMTPLRVRLDEVLPESFDAREKWGDLIHPIRDQGNCGASWAFSTTAVASDRLAIEYKKREELSPQHILSCNSNNQEGCEGGFLDRAWYYTRRRGLVTEQCYPYTSGQTNKGESCLVGPRKRDGNCPSGLPFSTEKVFKTTPPYRIRPLEREIMKEVMDNGPVQATFRVREDFYMYRSGVYRYSNVTRYDPPEAKLTGYHSVRIIGWGVERSPFGDISKYWLCANSWGENWGERGYFRILRGEDESEIESFIVGAFAKENRERRFGRGGGRRRFRNLKLRQRRRRRKDRKNKNKNGGRKSKKHGKKHDKKHGKKHGRKHRKQTETSV